ncbi:MAG: biopolymer transporter ExbD [Corticimicrobacter sp.]|uniref:ExbD/TolR family protein n=1 Tax=Corticimicrobacter sp. TaxID=2678536 RepID=UPI0032D9F32F
MNFRRTSSRDDTPEINVIPLIDVLLVMLIFLATSTTFARFSQLDVALPSAQASADSTHNALIFAISSDGLYALDGELLSASGPAEVVAALRARANGHSDAMLIIHADAQAPHQSVVTVMEAARQAGLSRIAFATQQQ